MKPMKVLGEAVEPMLPQVKQVCTAAFTRRQVFGWFAEVNILILHNIIPGEAPFTPIIATLVDCFRRYFWLELHFTCSGTAAFVSLLSSKYIHHGSRLGNYLCCAYSYGCGYSCSAEQETCPMPAVFLGFYFPQSTRWSRCMGTIVISYPMSQVLCY